VAICLLLTQVIGGVLFFVLRPPPFLLFTHVSEVAAALQSEAAADATRASSAPLGQPSERLEYLEPHLARRLGVPVQSVRLWRIGPRPPAMELADRTTIDPVIVGGYAAAARIGGGWVDVGLRPHHAVDALRRMGLWLLVTLVFIVPLALLLAARVTSPITAFARAADRLGRNPYAPPLRYSGPSEVLLAVQAFNDMQGRLRVFIDDRVRMIGAIAHDLRTPLTRLRLQVQGLPAGPRVRAEFEIELMQRMVEGALIYVKDATATPNRTPLRLGALIEAVIEDLDPFAGRVQASDGPDPVVEADENALRRVFCNLISNAVTHGGGAKAHVSVEDDWAIVRIDDDGPGIRDEDLERVFEPYVRLGENDTGIGLGLSIVRTIVTAHGGQVSLTNRAEGGLRAEVRLPLSLAAR
jgi:two-component system, OmpR family, sensor kinase